MSGFMPRLKEKKHGRHSPRQNSATLLFHGIP